MIEIKQITTVEELWKSGGAPTGNVLVDALVEFLKISKSNDLDYMAAGYGVRIRLLQEAIPVFVGVTPHEMIRRWRVFQAMDLLINTTMSEAEIAERCGFKDQRNLQILIRKYHQTTAAALRTGMPRRNSNYPYNESRDKLREIYRNAKKIRQELKKPAE